ncbi:MAG TPA: hypothetical protein VNT76_17285 [Candidatus Binatus sp.]|nr:hypothetical protein [Candidatus Binatus sp.]
MSIKKFKDWSSWWDGLRSVIMRTGATAILTQLTTLVGTNSVANMKIPGLADIGIGWKTALASLGIQFVIHTAIAAAKYVQDKPDPDIIEVEVPSDPRAFVKPNADSPPK